MNLETLREDAALKSIEPKDHLGHHIIEDKWAKDFGMRAVGGNGWCVNCATPVAIEVYRAGILSIDNLEMPNRETIS